MKSKMISFLALFTLLVSFFTPNNTAHAFATTWYVKSTADGPAIPANCPGNGCRLRDAIAAAAPGDIIRFTLPINSTITTVNGDFSISKELTIQASPANHLTIHGNDAERIFHIQSDPGNIMNVVIEGLTLTHGYTLEQHGGAIFNQNANVTLDNMVITQNTVFNSGSFGYYSSGGAIYNGGVMTITNSQITNNTATNVGGIYSSFGSTLNMTNVTVSGNQTSWVNGNVGGIFVASDSGASLSSTANFNQVYIINNISATGAGGLQIGNGANVTITNSSISGNAALDVGGMEVNSNANVTISNTIISNNQALNGNSGGIFVSPDASLTMTDATISGNSATTYGGGLTGWQDSKITLERVTVSGNSANEGGGMYINDNATANLTNVTIAGNAASNRAGGMLVYGAANLNNVTLAGNSAVNSTGGILTGNIETINIKNSIIADNTAPSLADCNGKLNSRGNNLIENVDVLNCIISGDTSTNIIGVDPMLDSLLDNGGSTLTMSLHANSPAIDSADNSSCANEDQRGYPRPQDGDINGIANCDMGSIEVAGLPAVFSLTRKTPSPTTASTVDFIVTFTKPVTNVDKNDFTLTTNGNIAGAIVSSVSGSGTNYTVTVETGSYNGSIRLDIPLSAIITDLDTVSLSNLPFTSGETYVVIKSPTFSDVPFDDFAWAQIESIYTAGITGGCSSSPLNYCPNNSVTRAQMAVFLLRGIHGSAYSPPAATGTVFTDVPSNAFAAAWIEQMVAEGITSGCGNGNYCPNSTVTRAQMAVFLLRAKYGSAYSPPVATGTVFTDVPSNGFAAAFIEQLVSEGITSGCGGGNYCPNSSVTRAQMAVFLQRTFNLP